MGWVVSVQFTVVYSSGYDIRKALAARDEMRLLFIGYCYKYFFSFLFSFLLVPFFFSFSDTHVAFAFASLFSLFE